MRRYKTSIEATLWPPVHRCGAASPPRAGFTPGISVEKSKEKEQNLQRMPIFTCHLFEVEKTITYQTSWRPSYYNYIVTDPPPKPHPPFPPLSATPSLYKHTQNGIALHARSRPRSPRPCNYTTGQKAFIFRVSKCLTSASCARLAEQAGVFHYKHF